MKKYYPHSSKETRHERITRRGQSHQLSRRALFRGIAAAGGLVGAEALIGQSNIGGWDGLTKLALAQESNLQNGFDVTRERYYIFCYFSGGWDILVGLDPRDPGFQ